MILWAAGQNGPRAIPGDYSVRLRVDQTSPLTQQFRIVPDPAAQIAAIRSGDVDLVIGVPVGSYEVVEGSDDIELVTRPSNRVFGLMFSTRSDSPLTYGIV